MLPPLRFELFKVPEPLRFSQAGRLPRLPQRDQLVRIKKTNNVGSPFGRDQSRNFGRERTSIHASLDFPPLIRPARKEHSNSLAQMAVKAFHLFEGRQLLLQQRPAHDSQIYGEENLIR
jgi:hypothetical protein